MNKVAQHGFAVVLAFAFVSPLALAQTEDRGAQPEQHDSNTLHKIGNAIQYPFRKTGENTSKAARKTGKALQYSVRKNGENASVSAHTAVGKKSVVRDRQMQQDKVVTPTVTTAPAPNS